jgi:HAD superfamily hydrolase (TIGR01509 family)
MNTNAAGTTGVDWSAIDAVIFDVDGTLFDHKALRPAMTIALLRHLLTDRHGWRDLMVIHAFRRKRDRLALAEATVIGDRQFEATAAATGVPRAEVEKIVARWLYREPLAFVPRHAFPGAAAFIAALRARGIRIGVFSDYPAKGKLKALGLTIDVIRDAAAGDIGRLKPHPVGFLRVAELLGVPPSRCLIIGDRNDRDGDGAKRGGFAFLRKTRGKWKPGQQQFRCYRHLAQELAEVSCHCSNTVLAKESVIAGPIFVDTDLL